MSDSPQAQDVPVVELTLDHLRALDIALDAGEKALVGHGSDDFWETLATARDELRQGSSTGGDDANSK